MRIKNIAIFLVFIMILTALPFSASAENIWREFYVSVNGNDTNPGTKEQPFATVKKAQEAVREVNNNMQGDIVVNIGGGTYFLDEMLDFTTADSGKNGYEIIYRGEEGNMPIISGGKQVTGFTPSPENPRIYQAKLTDVERVAAIYVNEERRFMAKAEKMLTGVKKPDRFNTDEWYAAHPNDVKDNYNYYDPETPFSYDGFYMSKEDIGFYENPEDILLSWGEAWKSQVVPVKSIEPNPDNNDQVIVRMDEGIWHLAVSANSGYEYHPRAQEPFMMMNAMELLDSPGEFYYNRKTEVLYYMPKPGENMETANVIVPVLEQMIYVMGEDVDKKAENITFRGLKIAHSAWYGWQKGYLGEQGHMLRGVNDAFFTFVYPSSLGGYAVTPSTVVVEMAENVNFCENYFFGIGGTALDMPNGVENCNVTGNAFSDLGDSAFYLGSVMHSDSIVGKDGVSDAPPENAGQLCLNNMYYHKVSSSYLGTGSANIRRAAGLDSTQDTNYPEDKYKTYVDEYHYYNAWKSNPLSPLRGEKSWVRYDFIRKYEIDKIAIAFDPDYVTDEEKTGFEVLVSNDKNFSEGSFIVVAKQETPADTVTEYTVPSDEKYRFVMVRTIGATPLAVSRLWAFTPDMEPMTKYERCRNVNFENNYIERYGLDIWRATGVMSFYCENIKINHNEIIDGVYSGMNFGWGWSASSTGSKNNDYSYNYLHNVNQMLHDGGGMYSLGRHENSTLTHNYVDGNGVGPRAYYSDQGTAGMLYEYNAAEDMSYVLGPYTPSVIENVYKNNYGTHSTICVYNDKSLVDNSVETPNIYVAGQPNKEVYGIIEEAGLMPQYEHIRNWVPEMSNNLCDKLYLYDQINYWDLRKSTKTTEADGILKKGVFGDGLGMFPIEKYYKLLKAKEVFDGVGTTNAFRELVYFENTIREVKESVRRYSLKDTFALAKETIKNSKVIADESSLLTSSNKVTQESTMGMDLASNVNTFANQVAELEKKATKISTKNEEFEILTSLEEAYNNFMEKRLSADISYVYVKGASNVEIDSKNATITVKIPLNEDMDERKFEIYPKGNAEIARVLPDKFDLTKSLVIPMYCAENKTYKHWILKAQYDYGTDTDVSKDSKWYTMSNLSEPVKKADDSTLLTGSPYVYMTDTYKKDTCGATVTFEPVSQNDIANFTFVVGTDRYDYFDINSKSSEFNRCEVVFDGDTASLYTVTNGTKTLIATKNVSPKMNEKNVFTYRFEQINNSKQVVITLNGETIFSEVLTLSVKGGYFGCYTDNINIRIY